MNAIFGIILLLSVATLTFIAPEGVLSAFLSGGEKALSLTLKMTVVYAVWLGVLNLFEKTGLSDKCARMTKPFNRLLFGKLPDSAENYIALNVSANILGMSGATTPMGIKAIRELEKHPNTRHAIDVFFVINATSVQLIPSSVLALRVKCGAASPSDIILPTILATLISTVIGVFLINLLRKRR